MVYRTTYNIPQTDEEYQLADPDYPRTVLPSEALFFFISHQKSLGLSEIVYAR